MKMLTRKRTQLLFLIYFHLIWIVLCRRIPQTNSNKDPKNGDTCGYAACPATIRSTNDENILNVHIIPHSHDDTGWLKTVDQYYLGSNRARFGENGLMQRVGVQYILDSVVKELMFNPNRRFIQVETAFLWRWWNEQDDRMQDEVRKLVNNGQLEFINGGWCMNDEAAAHYTDIIHQMSLGMRFLNDTFGDCGIPKVAWQVDPFGHSKEQANLFAELAFDGLFLGRLDYRDKIRRLSSKEMEMIWTTNKNGTKHLFTGINYNIYGPPPGFCWDLVGCNDEPLVDDYDSHSYNLDQKIHDFIEYVKIQAQSYQTNHIALTMGEDFQYSAAHSWFTNLDKLIKYVNAETNNNGVNLLYSSPSCYLQALYESKNVTQWPTKTDDFFPYASDEHGYWTGYFTSRPTSKRMIREASSTLNAAKQLVSKFESSNNKMGSTIDEMECNVVEALEDLGQAVAVTQHHDAITGTEKQYVTEDYHIRLDKSVQNFLDCASEQNNIEIGRYNCPLLNISQCDATENRKSFYVSVYNPLPRNRSWVIRLPISYHAQATVSLRVNGECVGDISNQILPIPLPVQNVPGRTSNARHELVFVSKDLPALQSTEYCVELEESATLPTSLTEPKLEQEMEKVELIKSSNGKIFHFNTTSNSLIKLQKPDSTGVLRDIQFTQEYCYYTGYQTGNRPSGAYVFRPNEVTPTPLGDPTTSKIFSGDLFYEIHQTFFHPLDNKHVSQVIRIPRENTSFPLYDIEIEWMVGPIPIEDNQGKEYIHRIHVDGLENAGLFYTDSNGRQYMKRQRNHRPDFDVPDVESLEPVTSNYYPITSSIYMEDPETKLRLTVLTDRSQGGGSINDNEIELMLHRRLLVDDHFGVGEALNETAFDKGLVARGKHYLLFDFNPEEAFQRTRLLANELYAQPLVTFDVDEQLTKGTSLSPTTTNEMIDLPPNVNLLTLEPISRPNENLFTTNLYLVRFEHLFDVDEHPDLSSPVKIPFKSFIEGYFDNEIKTVRETTLGGDRFKGDALNQKFHWLTKNNNECDKLHLCTSGKTSKVMNDGFDEIELQPMEIRTFQVELM